MTARLGWLPDVPDLRDKLFADVMRDIAFDAPVRGWWPPSWWPWKPKLPAAVDLRTTGMMPPVMDQGQLGSCFPAGTMITLADLTERPIENVAEGNTILAHDGSSQRVVKAMQRSYTGDMIKLQLQGWGYPLEATAEHPIFVVDNVAIRGSPGGFVAGELREVKATDLRVGDFVLMPGKPKGTVGRSVKEIKPAAYFSEEIHVDADGRIRLASAARENTLPGSVEVDADFARLVGLFLAEGSYRKTPDGSPCGLRFSFARHERNYQNFVVAALKRVFGAHAYIVDAKKPTVSNVRCDNATLARFFFGFCGERSTGKFVNPVFFASPQEIMLALLMGWMQGDGTQAMIRTTRERDGKVRKGVQTEGITASVVMHRDLFRLALQCGMKPSASVRKQESHQTVPARALVFMSSDVIRLFGDVAKAKIAEAGIVLNERLVRYKRHPLGYLCRIKAIDRAAVIGLPVYNFEATGPHTYVANSIAVHNCVENAWSAALAYLEAREAYPGIKAQSLAAGGAAPLPAIAVKPLSRLALYYSVRKAAGHLGADTGSSIRDGIKAVARDGIPREELWPYDLSKWNDAPSPEALAEGAHRRAVEYARLVTLDDMLACLAGGLPFVFGMSLYSAFEALEGSPARPAVLLPPWQHAVGATAQDYVGGHALLCAGYDLAQRRFLIRNSWGEVFGDGGHVWVPFDVVLSPNICDDFWCARKIPK